MEETTTQAPEAQASPKRPTFLTVLCILSFIGIGIGIIGAIPQMLMSDAMNMTMDMAEGMAESSEAMEAFEEMPGMSEAMNAMKYAKTLAIINLLFNLICLAAVILMWRLKKVGYYIYVVAELAPVIATIGLMGFSGLFGGTMAMLASIFPLAFIIMYGLNLKHMK